MEAGGTETGTGGPQDFARRQFREWGIEDRLDRIEALLVRLQPPGDPSLLPALAEATGCEWFTSGAVLRLARGEAMAAASEGQPEPSLSVALRHEGIGGAHALGRWLAGREGIERGGEERGSSLWRVCGFDPPNPLETSYPLSRPHQRATVEPT